MSELHIPQVLAGRYRLAEQVGAGSMAIVYRAYDETLGREIALKILSPKLLTDEKSRQRFLREARVVARLTHPHIMTLFDAGHDGAWYFLVMELINGTDLHGAIVAQGGALPINDTLHIIHGSLTALAYAHDQGVIHRDLKPSNIMLTTDNHIKVADFGLAHIHGDARLTDEGTIVGTLLYASPEMLKGQQVDSQADLYGIGAVFYELLTGSPPYHGDIPTAIISQILNAPVPQPRTVNPRVPIELSRIVVRLLAKSPDDRYESAKAVLVDLDKYLDKITLGTLEPANLPTPQHTSAAIEAERRRLAGLVEERILGSLDLLLSQASIYQTSLGNNPQAQLVASVLTSLARQSIQQARDLVDNLHPSVLETLGIEPALEALASQVLRTYGMRIVLSLQRLSERLPPHIELVVFRAVQAALERAVDHSRASQASIRLEKHHESLTCVFNDNGNVSTGLDTLQVVRQQLEQIGGTLETRLNQEGGLEMVISLHISPPVDLTPREIDVLRLLVEGLSNKAIAQALSISPRTVNFHLDNIYSKLDINSRTEAVAYALQHNLS